MKWVDAVSVGGALKTEWITKRCKIKLRDGSASCTQHIVSFFSLLLSRSLARGTHCSLTLQSLPLLKLMRRQISYGGAHTFALSLETFAPLTVPLFVYTITHTVVVSVFLIRSVSQYTNQVLPTSSASQCRPARRLRWIHGLLGKRKRACHESQAT